MFEDRPELLVERESDLGLVHAPVPAVLAHDPVVERTRQQRARGEGVAVDRRHRVGRQHHQPPDEPAQRQCGRRQLVVVGEVLEVEAVGEELAPARQDDRQRSFDGLEFVEDLVEATERIEVDAILPRVPGKYRDRALVGDVDVHGGSLLRAPK